MKKFRNQIKYWIGGLLGGPGIAVILQAWVIPDPSEWLVALIYILGFGIYAFIIFLTYMQRIRCLEFLEYMVHTRKEKKLTDGSVEIEDFGRIDENSTEIIEIFKEFI